MLGRRRRRRANINPALGQCIVFAGESSGPRAMPLFYIGFLRANPRAKLFMSTMRELYSQ